MKKIQFTLAALMFVFAACNTQEFVPSEGSSEEGKLTTVTIKASNGDADTKAAISNDLTFTWTAGDKIAVHTDAGQFYTSDELAIGGTTADFTVSLSGTRDGFAVYPASVAESWDGTNLTLTLPDTYTLAQVSGDESPLPMIAEDEGGSLAFKHVAGLLRLTISNIPSGTNKIKLDFNGRQVSGDFTIVSPVAGTSTIAAASCTKGTDDIIWITGTPSIDPVTVNIPLPTGATYSDITVSAWNDGVALRGQVVAFNTYTPSRAHGKKLNAALNLGAFSIASGKYAVFAPGNLVATITGVDNEESPTYATSATWAFHEHQYDMVHVNPAPYYPVPAANPVVATQSFAVGSKIDLFGWSTDQTYYGINSSMTQEDYRGSYQEWGKNVIDGYAADVWRTLKGGYSTGTEEEKGEWYYLLEGRTDAANKFNIGTVGGTKGLIVIPDNFTDPNTNGGTSAFVPSSSIPTPIENNADWASNTYSAGTQWDAMENAGAIFFPADGYREGVNLFRVGYKAYYWTSSPQGNVLDYARNWFFHNPKENTGDPVLIHTVNGNDLRRCARAVRLARDLN